MQTTYLARIVVAALAVVVAVVASGVLSGPAAAANNKVALGGSAGIALGDTLCTLATIGHDNTRGLVGFTASQCGGPGTQVRVNGTNNIVGSVAASNSDLDYAVIKFDPAKVAPIANVDGFAINGIGPNPAPTSKRAGWAPTPVPAVHRLPQPGCPVASRTRLAPTASPGLVRANLPLRVGQNGVMSRTNIDIDDELVAAAQRMYRLDSKREAVDLALRRLVGEPLSRDEALALQGSGFDFTNDEIESLSDAYLEPPDQS